MVSNKPSTSIHGRRVSHFVLVDTAAGFGICWGKSAFQRHGVTAARTFLHKIVSLQLEDIGILVRMSTGEFAGSSLRLRLGTALRGLGQVCRLEFTAGGGVGRRKM